MKDKIIVYLGLAVIFYLISSWININLNPIDWGIWSKVIYSVGALYSLKIFLTDIQEW